MTTQGPAISTAGLTKHYADVQALTDLSVEVPVVVAMVEPLATSQTR